nr:phosphotriesterase [Chloroflexota bacterium]
MTHLTTVTGPLAADAVGVAEAHGHVWIDAPVAGAPALTDEQAAAAELALFNAAGGTLVVDCQPGGCGRDGRVLARLSAQSGVAVVAASGFHLR